MAARGAGEKGRPRYRRRIRVGRSIFDYMEEAEKGTKSNKYCSKTVLRDEASVEQFFVSRLLKDLGYADKEIRPKKSLAEIVVARGRKKERYKPDYVMVCSAKPRWLIDAKSPEEDIEKWTYQGAGYALGLNREFSDENPCQYYVITNGIEFKVFKWDESSPVLALAFSEFVEGNPSFLALQSLFGAKAVRMGWPTAKTRKPEVVVLHKPSVEKVKGIFNACHRLIWKTEKMNPQPAFFEFVKVMFVKLWEDRRLHEDTTLGPLIKSGQPIPRDRIVFSTQWIETLQERGVENPIC